MFSRFFIDRPIFAAVLSILITLAGGLAAVSLPVAQFPRITPPTINVSCNYPGASAKDVAEAVAAPLEKEINGVEGMMYMSSSSTNDGSYNLTVTFHQGTDADVAQVLVQNRVGLAMNKLPDVIKATGVVTRKRSPDMLMGISINSPGGRYDQLASDGRTTYPGTGISLGVTRLVVPLVAEDPDQLENVFLGAFACLEQEAQVARVLLDRWGVAA